MPEPRALDRLRAVAPTISAGILTADLLKLGQEIALIEQTGVQLVHVDVMDGCFCPMMTVGPPLIKAIRTTMLKDVHLMVVDPIDKLHAYVGAGADIITVHVEATHHVHRVLQILTEVRNANDSERGIVRGIAVNPGTPIEVVRPLLDEVDMVTVMAVNPGWGGQPFIRNVKTRIEAVHDMAHDAQRDILTAVDGGVKKDNIADVAAMGADIIVTGSAVFDGKDPAGNAHLMLEEVARVKRR
jgi:ribulose-phosphate 3-epimerase